MRLDDGTTLVKDSKNPDGSVLAFTADGWRAFIGSVKDGEVKLP
jgi:hypothetical protein